MDLDLTGNQELLVQTSNRFIESAFPLETVRARAAKGATADASYWRQAAELGWFSMLVPEDRGGGGLSDNPVLDCALIAQARGALLQPASFVGNNVTALVLATDGTPDHQSKVLPQLMAGAESATWAVTAPGNDGAPSAGVRADRRGGAYFLSGKKTMVQDAGTSDWLLVTAQSDQGPCQFLLPREAAGISITEMDGLDITRRFSEVTFDGAEVALSALLGEDGRAAATIERQLQVACVLTVAESVGAMDHDFAMAVQYATDRTAFGRPIGSFQAVKHLLADTSLMLEMSKAMVLAAAQAVGSTDDDAGQVASMAKAFVGDCGIELAHNCFQVFGGIGYTWEHDQHLYLRRLTTDAALYGTPTWHRERLCQLAHL